MKVVHCACGANIEASDDDEIVRKVQAHVASEHPELQSEFTPDKILQIAHDH